MAYKQMVTPKASANTVDCLRPQRCIVLESNSVLQLWWKSSRLLCNHAFPIACWFPGIFLARKAWTWGHILLVSVPEKVSNTPLLLLKYKEREYHMQWPKHIIIHIKWHHQSSLQESFYLIIIIPKSKIKETFYFL